MAHLVITSTTNAISVVLNDYASVFGVQKATYRKDKVIYVKLDSTDVHVAIDGEREWEVSTDGASDSLIIDSIDGVAPSSLADLYIKLIALIA